MDKIEISGYTLAVIIMISALISGSFVYFDMEEQLSKLEENYCWLNLHTYEDFLYDEPSNSTTIGDVFMYINFKELREGCKREGYHPNRFTEDVRKTSEERK